LMKEAVKNVPGWNTLADNGCTVSNTSMQQLDADNITWEVDNKGHTHSLCGGYKYCGGRGTGLTLSVLAISRAAWDGYG
jgi:hypothetical protein